MIPLLSELPSIMVSLSILHPLIALNLLSMTFTCTFCASQMSDKINANMNMQGVLLINYIVTKNKNQENFFVDILLLIS